MSQIFFKDFKAIVFFSYNAKEIAIGRTYMDKLKRNRDVSHPNKLLQNWSFFHNRHDFSLHYFILHCAQTVPLVLNF